MKAAGAFEGLPRELRTRHNMRAIYCKNRNGATQQTLFSRPRPLFAQIDTRLLGPGWCWFAWPFLLASRHKTAVICRSAQDANLVTGIFFGAMEACIDVPPVAETSTRNGDGSENKRCGEKIEVR